MVKDSFETQPITATITCPVCGETLLYGDRQCRFCRATIDEDDAAESVVTHALLMNAAKSANIIRALRNLLYVVAALILLGVVTRNPGTVTTALIISVLNIIAPIRWRKKYGHIALHDGDLQRAQKDMKLELYLWGSAILVEAIAWSLLALTR
jgi:predicted nucleic acid-binding Zn ribbon protein